MTLHPSTPVLVGVGRVTNRPGTEGDGALTDRPEPVALMAEALLRAAEDCDGSPVGGAARAGRRLLDKADVVQVVDPVSWAYVDPGALVAAALGRDDVRTVTTHPGGHGPQALVNATALAVGRGELDVAVIVAGECGYTQEAALRHPDRPVLSWTIQPADVAPPARFGTDRRPATDTEEARGLDRPVHVFPFFETALRSDRGRTPEEHLARIGARWARLSALAADEPFAWLREPRTAEEVVTPSDDNRPVAHPYTKLLTANAQVDQAAALLLCSAGAAEAAGVPRDRWVFPLAGADVEDHWFLSHRADFHSSPAVRLAGRAALALAGRRVGDVAHLDLYPCAPAVVEITATELGIDADDPSRPLSVTGGLTFAGAPGYGYGVGAVAALVDVLRRDPGSTGLVTGVGGYLSSHSVGCYGTEPPGPDDPDVGDALEGATVEVAAGFRWADPQAAVGSLPQCVPDGDARGEVTVEAYSVRYDRGGAPERAVLACRTPEGRRAWASATDPDHLALLVSEEGCGLLGVLGGDGTIDLG
jgi:acetyl-CoA C-acetyltransferase